MFTGFLTFAAVMISLNLMLAGATGKLYDFWVGRRGGGKVFAEISSPSVRLLLSSLGLVFFALTLFFGWRALVEVVR